MYISFTFMYMSLLLFALVYGNALTVFHLINRKQKYFPYNNTSFLIKCKGVFKLLWQYYVFISTT